MEVYIFIAILSAILSIIMIVKYFQATANIKEIKNKLCPPLPELPNLKAIEPGQDKPKLKSTNIELESEPEGIDYTFQILGVIIFFIIVIFCVGISSSSIKTTTVSSIKENKKITFDVPEIKQIVLDIPEIKPKKVKQKKAKQKDENYEYIHSKWEKEEVKTVKAIQEKEFVFPESNKIIASQIQENKQPIEIKKESNINDEGDGLIGVIKEALKARKLKKKAKQMEKLAGN